MSICTSSRKQNPTRKNMVVVASLPLALGLPMLTMPNISVPTASKKVSGMDIVNTVCISVV